MRFELQLIAPIAVGSQVTVYRVELLKEQFFGEPKWVAAPEHTLVADDTTKVVYVRRFMIEAGFGYGHVTLAAPYRVADEPVRGQVTGCVVLTDFGDGVRNLTLLDVEPDVAGYR